MSSKDEVYAGIGKIMHAVQTIEYNLCKVVSLNNFINALKSGKITKINSKEFMEDTERIYEEFTHKPLGYTVEEAKNTKCFSEEYLKKLEYALHKRNFYAHRFFKKDFSNNYLDNNPELLLKDINRDLKEFQEIINSSADEFIKLRDSILKK